MTKRLKIVRWVSLGFVIAYLLTDLVLWLLGWPTFSQQFLVDAVDQPAWFFLLGFAMGHLAWPQYVKQTVSKK